MRLMDGRSLGYTEFGDPSGAPLINCHGGLSSGLDIRGVEPVARELGVRVISPDRPGIGRSDRRPGRTLLDWPSDVVALAGTLGIDRFAALGWSAGGPYAAAIAWALPERVSAAGLVASAIPGDWPGMERELGRMDRRLIRLSTRAPWADRIAFRAMGALARRSPAGFRRLSALTLDPASRELLTAAPARDFSDAIAEGMRDPDGVLDDYRVLDAPWGFDPAEIRAPVVIWQGDADTLVPVTWGERLAQRIPGAELRICHGDGHFLALGRYAEILGVLAPGAPDEQSQSE